MTSKSDRSNSINILILSKLSSDAPSTPAETKAPKPVINNEATLNNSTKGTLRGRHENISRLALPSYQAVRLGSPFRPGAWTPFPEGCDVSSRECITRYTLWIHRGRPFDR